MKTTQTLFSRYKQMINNMWADGQRRYTANELNTFVGQYESSTPWKRSYNNTFYTTRCYQSALKNLGCITPIKRGLWKINGPIPEWFGSFHINALTSKWALQELEKSSFYWKSLPENHKVNPWKNIDPMRVMASINSPKISSPKAIQADLIQYSFESQCNIQNVVLTIKHLAMVSPSSNSMNPAVDIVDTMYFIGLTKKRELSFNESKTFFELLGAEETFILECKTLEARVKEEVRLKFIKDTQVQTETGMSQEQLTKLLRKFGEMVKKDVMDIVKQELRGLDESEVVSLSFDESSRQLDVEINDREIISIVEDAVEEDASLEDMLDAFILAEVMFKK